VEGEATLKVQSEKVAHGKFALQVHYPAGKSSLAFLTNDKLPAELKEHLFGRAYVFITPKIPQGHLVMLPVGDGDHPLGGWGEGGREGVCVSRIRDAAFGGRVQADCRGGAAVG